MLNPANILVVDNELGSQTLLRLLLQQAGYTVQVAHTAQAALDLHAASDLVLLDVLLSGMNGFAVCVELRKWSVVPIVMLTALNSAEEISYGLRVGADDYITKPYHRRVLIARVQAVLRRSIGHPPPRPTSSFLVTPELLLNDTLHEVWVRGTLVTLTPREYKVLRLLMSHPNHVFSKSELSQSVWGHLSPIDTNHIEATISRLRQKIEINPAQPRLLLTKYKIGYLITQSPPPAHDS